MAAMVVMGATASLESRSASVALPRRLTQIPKARCSLMAPMVVPVATPAYSGRAGMGVPAVTASTAAGVAMAVMVAMAAR
jgi:hypothetical protein